MLKGRNILLAVTGSIAAYKAASLASMLVKQHADVHVIMTKNAEQFISPVTFETLTGNKVIDDTFDRNWVRMASLWPVECSAICPMASSTLSTTLTARM